jgi:chromosome segregation ATPase
MKKEELIKLGLTEEQADAALIIHGKDIETHKTKIETLSTENETLQGQVQEATTTIEGFKKLDVDGIKAKADEWQAKAQQTEEELQQTREQMEDSIAEMEFNQTLRDALVEANAKNPVAVSALLDFEKLGVAEDGTITGLEDQLKVIKEENDYLFIPEGDNPQIITGSHNPKQIFSDATVEAARKAAGLPPKTE